MSEQSNEDVVRGVYEAFGRGDLPGVLGRLADDVEWSWIGPSSIPFAGTRQGLEQVAEWFSIIADAAEFHRFEPGGFEFVSQGDTVVVLGSEDATAKSTGRRFEQQWVQFFTLENGKIARFREFPDTATVVTAFEVA